MQSLPNANCSLVRPNFCTPYCLTKRTQSASDVLMMKSSILIELLILLKGVIDLLSEEEVLDPGLLEGWFDSERERTSAIGEVMIASISSTNWNPF